MKKPVGRPPRSKNEIMEFQSIIAKHALALYRAEGFKAVSMRRLAKEVGCAPMTIYAHFEGKTDILRHLWADVLTDVSGEIQEKLKPVTSPVERLQTAAQTFVSFWIDHPDHFRMVFMSNDVTRSDVSTFIMDAQTLVHFTMFTTLVQDALPDDNGIKARTDTLIAGMIGIALCANTIRDYPWVSAQVMTDRLLTSIIDPVNIAL